MLCRYRILLIFLFLIFIFQSISSLMIEMSPQYSILNSDLNKEVCDDFEVYSDSPVSLFVESRWSAKGETRNLSDYNSGIYDFKESITDLGVVNNMRVFKYCLNSDISGKFYGVLLVRVENSSAGIGSWIELNAKGESSVIQNGLNKLTGSLILSGDSESDNFLFSLLIGTSGILGTLLIVLLLIGRKKRVE